MMWGKGTKRMANQDVFRGVWLKGQACGWYVILPLSCGTWGLAFRVDANPQYRGVKKFHCGDCHAGFYKADTRHGYVSQEGTTWTHCSRLS